MNNNHKTQNVAIDIFYKFFLQICLISRHPISNIAAIKARDHKFEHSGWWMVGRRIEGWCSVYCRL
jgi:hypothetical protein